MQRSFSITHIQLTRSTIQTLWDACQELFQPSPPGYGEGEVETTSLDIDTKSAGSYSDEILGNKIARLLDSPLAHGPLLDGLTISVRVRYKETPKGPEDKRRVWQLESKRRSIRVSISSSFGARVRADGEDEWLQRVTGSIEPLLRSLTYSREPKRWALTISTFLGVLLVSTAGAFVSRDPSVIALGVLFGFFAGLGVNFYTDLKWDQSLICVDDRLPESSGLVKSATSILIGLLVAVAGALIAYWLTGLH